MKKLLLLVPIVFLTACASTKSNDYQLYLEAQKSLNKDFTVAETARIAALTEMVKSADPAVRATGLMLLQQLQAGSKTVTIEPPKKNLLGL